MSMTLEYMHKRERIKGERAKIKWSLKRLTMLKNLAYEVAYEVGRKSWIATGLTNSTHSLTYSRGRHMYGRHAEKSPQIGLCEEW